jgi:hypothetical protein
MSPKIVFNGNEYDGVESMPAEVRREYESALGALGAADREKVESALGHGTRVKVNVAVHRKYRINGKEYDSVEAMPADVRAAFERTLAANPSLADTTATRVATPSSVAIPSSPPAIDPGDSARGARLRIAVWVVAGLIVLFWLLLRR